MLALPPAALGRFDNLYIMNRELPLVSIITPVYNGSNYLAELIDSVLAQDYPRIEHIVIDDGSSDEGRTVAVLDRYPHLSWWSRENRGQIATVNEGLSRARGEIVTVVNADDYYVSSAAIRHLVDLLVADPQMDFAFGRTVLVDADRSRSIVQPPKWRWPLFLMKRGFGLYHCSIAVRRDFLTMNNLVFDADMGSSSDIDWQIRLSRTARRFGRSGAFITAFRRHSASVGAQIRGRDLRREGKTVRSRYGISPVLVAVVSGSLKLRARLIWISCLVRPGKANRLMSALKTGGRGGWGSFRRPL